MSWVLVTGGAGYIGSHTCVSLLEAGHKVVVVDNLCNAHEEALHRVEKLAKRPLEAFYRVDVRDDEAMAAVFRAHPIDVVIHFAALKSVGESVSSPLAYYDNNVGGTIALLRAMSKAGVPRIVFSSSATVYGEPAEMPIKEDCATAPENPYGWTKWMMERVLADVVASGVDLSVVVLRYFNPVGAHPSGCMGEDPNGVPNNLMPYISQVAVGRRKRLAVFGDDYPTPDGTGVRDYIHVMDLAEGHVCAVERVQDLPGLTTLNLGTGRGYSVLEVVKAFENASGRKIAWEVVPRRPGDAGQCWADPARAQQVLGWRAERGLAEMCADAWRWQQANPAGYRKGAEGEK